MKKLLVISAVTFVLLMLGFSGCFQDGNEDKQNNENPETSLFIGKWKTTIYYVDVNDVNKTKYEETSSNSTFYANGTMSSESVVDNESIWTHFIVENNQICIGEADAQDYYCYYFEFLNNQTKARLWTYITNSDTGETILYVIEMTKVR